MPVAGTQAHEVPLQCSMMPVTPPVENPTAQALRAEVAVTLTSGAAAGLGTRPWAFVVRCLAAAPGVYLTAADVGSYHDRVIVWLNGTFGAGKTATAAALVPLIPQARLFDPETVGYMLQPNLADHPVSDFQHWAPWRPLVVATATELTRYTGEHLIAAQTIMNRDYLAEIITGLQAAGVAVFHILLDASDDALRRRIEASAEARQWRLDHLTEYRQARGWLRREADLVLDTTLLTAAQAALEIASALPSLANRHS